MKALAVLACLALLAAPVASAHHGGPHNNWVNCEGVPPSLWEACMDADAAIADLRDGMASTLRLVGLR